MGRAKQTRKAKMKRRRPFGRSKREHKLYAPNILLTLVLLLSGCTTIKYNPQTQEVEYQSVGGKSFDSLSITRLDDGSIEIVVNKYQHEGIGPIIEGAVRGAIRGVK